MSVEYPELKSFRTHSNYVKCLGNLLKSSSLKVIKTDQIKSIRCIEQKKFFNLYKLTNASIKKDIELIKKDKSFSFIAAPWFPVKCYYALYYLESIFISLIDESMSGFSKGGHGGVRRKFQGFYSSGLLSF